MNGPVDQVWFHVFSFETFGLFQIFLPWGIQSSFSSYYAMAYKCVWLVIGLSRCWIFQRMEPLFHSPLPSHPQLGALQQWLLHKWVRKEWLLRSIQWGTMRYTPIRNPERRHSLIRHLLSLAVIHGYALLWPRERRPELPKGGYIKSSKKGHMQLSQWPRP